MGMRVDPKIMTAAERAGMLTPHFMAALAASLDTPCSSTLVVAGGQTIMVCVRAGAALQAWGMDARTTLRLLQWPPCAPSQLP